MIPGCRMWLNQSGASVGVRLPKMKSIFSISESSQATKWSLFVLVCFSFTFARSLGKSSEIKSAVITTSSNLKCNYTVALSGRRLRSKSIRPWMKRDRLIDLCMSSEGQTRGTKRNAQSARVGQALWWRWWGGVTDLWVKHGLLMGEGEYWIRQRQMECERQRERNSDVCLLTSTLFPN